MTANLGKLCAKLSIAALLVVGVAADAGRLAMAQSDGSQEGSAKQSYPVSLADELWDADDKQFVALLRQNPGLVDFILDNGLTALAAAALKGSEEGVRILLRRGADPDLGKIRPLAAR